MNTLNAKTEPLVLVLVGLPGSGKSTLAKNRNWPVLSSDHLRFLIADDVTNQSVNGPVFQLLHELLRQRLTILRPLTCIDATSLTIAERRPYIALAREAGARVEALYFDVPLETCQQRNLGRSRVVPPEAMLLLASRLVVPTVEEGFDAVNVVKE